MFVQSWPPETEPVLAVNRAYMHAIRSTDERASCQRTLSPFSLPMLDERRGLAVDRSIIFEGDRDGPTGLEAPGGYQIRPTDSGMPTTFCSARRSISLWLYPISSKIIAVCCPKEANGLPGSHGVAPKRSAGR